jgi:hypothetical protein
MNTFKVELLNPKALKLLQELAALKLITLTDATTAKGQFLKLAERMRKVDAPDLEEIQREVKAVRKSRPASR